MSESGPIYSKDHIPYDYIIIIDAGSKGSRVFVYNWLNPFFALQQGHNFKNDTFEGFKLVKRFDIKNSANVNDDTEAETDNSLDANKVNSSPKFPILHSSKNWHRKITPGISTFNESPQKVGNRHLKHLLRLASSVVPKSQHYRTPIFLHSTGGMRLLTLTDQQKILDSVCNYLITNSDFYLPDCPSHVNIIDGDVEGLYGWLSINYMVGTFDAPANHQHGKNHTTYGLLDMGGASTQVVFQPNITEIKEHQNNLYRLKLTELPDLVPEPNNNHSYKSPEKVWFDIYSDSFLGFGMFQAHDKYLSFLLDDYKKGHNINEQTKYFGRITHPLSDPCLPKGYTTGSSINDFSVDFTGESNFQSCLTSIFPVLQNSTYGSKYKKGNCKSFEEKKDVSACLFDELIPSFDFEVNHFFGVSGYWDAITSLLAYDKTYSENEDEKSQTGKEADTYDYNVIYEKTSSLCSRSFSELMELNDQKPENFQLSQEELSNLCFKSSWILNFLHLGLGFPRFGIDSLPKNDRFQSLQLADKVGGSSFSWTLGRALIYANDEYVQAYNNYTSQIFGIGGQEVELLRRPGFYHSASSGVYNFGAEVNGISARPIFTAPTKNAKYKYYDYEFRIESKTNESKWYIQPHRWNGMLIFCLLLGFIVWLMVGKNARSAFLDKVKRKVANSMTTLRNIGSLTRSFQYDLISTSSDVRTDLEGGQFELNNITSKDITNEDTAGRADEFKIDSDED